MSHQPHCASNSKDINGIPLMCSCSVQSELPASTGSGALQQAAIIAAWHALNSVLAVRDGISDGLIKNIIALLEAAKEGRAYEASEVELRVALEESVKLQSHYAVLLNGWDGGQRIHFGDAAAWMGRLRETKTLPSNDRDQRPGP